MPKKISVKITKPFDVLWFGEMPGKGALHQEARAKSIAHMASSPGYISHFITEESINTRAFVFVFDTTEQFYAARTAAHQLADIAEITAERIAYEEANGFVREFIEEDI